MGQPNFHREGSKPDAELVMAARGGEAPSLGLLLERYRPQLYAIALSMLGYTSDAEDAVHETFVTALTRLDGLRDPAAVGGWLHSILRNHCLMALRRRRPCAKPAETDRVFRELADEERIESRIESRDLRDWVWAALGRLPEMQRATVMLRYFGSSPSYEEIAAILGVPVGTVRSRLSDAKVRLSELLLASAVLSDRDHQKLVAERLAFYVAEFRSLYGGGRDRFLAHYADDLEIGLAGGPRRLGRHLFAEIVDEDTGDGVRAEPVRALASGNVTVLEGNFLNPPEDPFHCPPGFAFVLFHGEHQVRGMRIYNSARPARSEE
ncbi:RNA polymerase sigma factor [Mesorhizobium sp. B3-2-1]|uniref:RNA polymerase sigma factor n=1 Tax=Mesorhizobium sp. B3-2-1 TaxID=2589891 RepID=UPI00112B3F8F|nr:RNA polymerase sigma factor [Mesorhizobium sp. B3-2-1]TPI32945.1 RNA polymerase sigma factor [Mesorhizobium sp. B3-2-1]